MPPDGFTVLEPLEAWSCKNKTGDRPATKGNALRQLKLLAYRLGATALMDVEFTGHNYQTYKRPNKSNLLFLLSHKGKKKKENPKAGTANNDHIN